MANSTVNVYDGTTLLGTATANATGAWSFVTVPLPDGVHSFTATDTVSGITSAASAVMSVTIDTVAPVAPSITSFTTDSGTKGDGITNDNTLTLSGTAEANSTVKVFDGATLLGSVAANGSGAWSYTTAALADGAHSLTATATDAAGNTGAASAGLGDHYRSGKAQCTGHCERHDCQYESGDANRHRGSQQHGECVRRRDAGWNSDSGRQWCMELHDQPTVGRPACFHCDGDRCGGQYKSGFSTL